jgi:hypothetical protein
MLHFDSLAGGIPFLHYQHPHPITTEFSRTFFWTKEIPLRPATLRIEMREDQSPPFHMNDMRNSKGSNALQYEQKSPAGSVVRGLSGNVLVGKAPRNHHHLVGFMYLV